MGPAELRKYDRAASVVFLKTSEPFGGLSNMASGYPLYIQGVRIRTSEALYQACRFPHLPHVQRLIIKQASPMTAKMKSKPYRNDSRPDWDEVRVKVMRWCLRVKLAQNWPTFSSLLLGTGNKPIVEESRRDDFWGAKRENEYILVGKNVLGRLLMELRQAVKSRGREPLLFVESPSIPLFLLLGCQIPQIVGGGIDPVSTVESTGRHGAQDSARTRSRAQVSLINHPVAKQPPTRTYVSGRAEHSRMDRIKTYPAMKHSGVKWIGEVPEHWNVKRLKNVVHLTERKVESDETHPLLYVGMDNIESWVGRILPIDPEVVPTGTANKFETGNTLFGKLRPYLAKACNPNFDGLCSTELLVLRSVAIDRRVLLYLLLCDGFINLVDSSTYGSKMPRTSWDFVGSCLVPIAPPTDQLAIADFLDRETSRLDTLVEKKRSLIARLKEKRTALISCTVTCGLPPNAALAAGLDPQPKLKFTGIEWLRDVPEHWEVKRLRRISDVITVGVVVNPSNYVADEGVPFLLGGDVREFHIDTTKCKRCLVDVSNGPLRKSRLAAGDLVVVRVGYPGIAAVVSQDLEGANCASMMIVRRNRRFVSQWLAYAFNSQPGRDQIDLVQYGAAQKQFNISHAVDFTFPFPPLSEQYAIAEFLDHETGKIDNLVETIETAIGRLHEYRASLITDAVTGKIDVTETTLVSESLAAPPSIVTRPA